MDQIDLIFSCFEILFIFCNLANAMIKSKQISADTNHIQSNSLTIFDLDNIAHTMYFKYQTYMSIFPRILLLPDCTHIISHYKQYFPGDNIITGTLSSAAQHL